MFRSTNTLQPGQLFGVSIESVVEQENSGFLVPLLVKRCTQEIEKRGLDIIGLYRLCGSETKKKMLREAFEADPEAVDLSSENVPDINVITSRLNNKLNGLVVWKFHFATFKLFHFQLVLGTPCISFKI